MASEFRIMLPDGKRIKLLYGKDDVEGKKISQVLDLLNRYIVNDEGFNNRMKEIRDSKELTEVEKKERIEELIKFKSSKSLHEYCYKNWMMTGFSSNKYGVSERCKFFLDRLGTFILLGFFRNGMINTDYMTKELGKREIPASLTSSNIQDVIYGSNTNDSYSGDASGINTIVANEVISSKEFDVDDDGKTLFLKSGGSEKSRDKSESNESRIEKIFHLEPYEKRILVKLKNEDCYSQKEINKLTEEMDHDEKKAWMKRNFKNIYNENIYEYRRKKFKGRKGLIDRRKPYAWEWCYVNSENEFSFKGREYKIKNSVQQYRVSRDNQCEMDKIFVVAQCKKIYERKKIDNEIIVNFPKEEIIEDKVYFFDMNIKEIKRANISKIERR